MRGRRDPVLRLVAAAATAGLALGAASGAGASFASASAVSHSVSTATLQPPSAAASANINCVVLVSTQVRVTWTATTSPFADGYEILRSATSGGPYSSVGTVAGLAATSFTDTSVAFSTTYHYVVRATKNNWRSQDSNQSSITTPSTLCIL